VDKLLVDYWRDQAPGTIPTVEHSDEQPAPYDGPAVQERVAEWKKLKEAEQDELADEESAEDTDPERGSHGRKRRRGGARGHRRRSDDKGKAPATDTGTPSSRGRRRARTVFYSPRDYVSGEEDAASDHEASEEASQSSGGPGRAPRAAAGDKKTLRQLEEHVKRANKEVRAAQHNRRVAEAALKSWLKLYARRK